MALRRGFKTEANEIAREIRAELNLKSAEPLNPWRLAEHLAIPIIPLSAWRRHIPEAVVHLSEIEPESFSAVTVFFGTKRVIVHNDAHSRGRQAADIAHELAHALLGHPPSAAIDERGCRYWNEDLEDEADWLSGALLVSEEAALAVALSKQSVPEAARVYGVSKAMMQWRLNVTGAYQRISRYKRR
jgi:Zn-dependent peptidase ImmA (M78 family)